MDLQEVGWEKDCIWRWVGTGGQLLWMRCWTFRFHTVVLLVWPFTVHVLSCCIIHFRGSVNI